MKFNSAKLFLVFFSLLFISTFIYKYNIVFGETKYKAKVTDFSSAKRVLRRFYKKIGVDFYCGCTFSEDPIAKGRFLIDSNSCGLKERSNATRQKFIEWEHIVPAHSFGSKRECWTKVDCKSNGKAVRGRKCCQSIDPEFNQIEADLHNILPVPGEINADRGIFEYGEVEGEPREYGLCDFEVNFKTKTAEPKESIRGDIARIYFYMESEWKIPIPEAKKNLYQTWDKLDPPDTLEIRKNEIIERIQGRKNPFIP